MWPLGSGDLDALLLTLRLALTVTVFLVVIGTPMAWWLSRTHCRYRSVVEAMIALPLFLPPSVLGFYLLIAMGPSGPFGSLTQILGLGLWAFTFKGLVVASLFYSLPFVVQPLQATFQTISPRLLEAAATLRAGPLDQFFSVVVPMAKPGFLTAAVLGFAHTVGEFGIVLMIGGNIPGETRLASVQIYDHVEALEYPEAHALSIILVILAFLALLLLYALNGSRSPIWGKG
jgi:molybdate transport system permease protein